MKQSEDNNFLNDFIHVGWAAFYCTLQDGKYFSCQKSCRLASFYILQNTRTGTCCAKNRAANIVYTEKV